jgi:hypothetical protein
MFYLQQEQFSSTNSKSLPAKDAHIRALCLSDSDVCEKYRMGCACKNYDIAKDIN